MESRDSEGVPFASLESLRPGIVVIMTITKIENLHTDTRRKFTDSKNAILFDLRRKLTKLSRKRRFRKVASPGAWPFELLLVVNTSF